MHFNSRPNEHVSSNFRLEDPHFQTTAMRPSNSFFPHLGGQRFDASLESSAGHIYGNFYNGYSGNNFESGLVNPMMNPGGGPFKRKNPSIYEACDRGTIHTCEGSSSSSVQFHHDKTSYNCQNYHPLNSASRAGTFPIGVEDSVGNVRTRPRLHVESNNWRTQLPSYSTHYGSSSHNTINPLSEGIDLNSNATSHEQVLTAPVTNGRSLYPG